MNLEFSIEETIRKRHSVRTYSDQPISLMTRDKINKFIETLSNPFSVKVNFSLLEVGESSNSEKLGTYGVIKGAVNFIGATVENTEFAMEALGYEFEKLILYLTSLGIGTCWLGGTFNRNSFKNALDIKENEIFPAISPFGYPANKKRFADSLVRKIAKSDQREPWDKLFFTNDFASQLSQTEAKEYALPLEMLRLAPSASNKQPWRIVKDNTTFHFFEAQTPAYSRFANDIQKVDIGIGACHFQLSALENGLKGEFKKLDVPAIVLPEHVIYRFSWVAE